MRETSSNVLGLLESERLLDQLKKENFGLKMRIYFLQENIDKLTPEGLSNIVREHAKLREMIEKGKLIRPGMELKNYELKLQELEAQLVEKTTTNSKLFNALQKANDKASSNYSPKEAKLKQKYAKYKKMKQDVEMLKNSMPSRKDFEFINAAVKLATQKLKFIHQNLLMRREY